jgi:hypothetical protein
MQEETAMIEEAVVGAAQRENPGRLRALHQYRLVARRDTWEAANAVPMRGQARLAMILSAYVPRETASKLLTSDTDDGPKYAGAFGELNWWRGR